MDEKSEAFSADEAFSALQWWSDAGVDILVDEEARDWLAAKSEPAAAPLKVEGAQAKTEDAPEDGQMFPDQLDLFQTWLSDSEHLPFAFPAAPRVCPSGDPQSGLMMITDMPAIEDCETGALISGEAGRLFDRMLAAIGRDRGSIYLASLSCLRAPSGSFTEESAVRCATLARHHIGLAVPKAALLLGDNCCKALLGMAVMQARGRWHQISTHAGHIPAMASFHPSYLLDRPAAKKHAWADLLMLMEKLDQ